MRAKLRPTLCNPVECTPPGSSVHGILQARVLEWVAPCPPPGDLPNPGIKPMSLTSACVGRQILYHEHHLKSPSYAWSCVKKNFLFLMPKQVYVHVYVYSVRAFCLFLLLSSSTQKNHFYCSRTYCFHLIIYCGHLSNIY